MGCVCAWVRVFIHVFGEWTTTFLSLRSESKFKRFHLASPSPSQCVGLGKRSISEVTVTNPSLDVRVSEQREREERWAQRRDKDFHSASSPRCLSTCTSHSFTSAPHLGLDLVLNSREM